MLKTYNSDNPKQTLFKVRRTTRKGVCLIEPRLIMWKKGICFLFKSSEQIALNVSYYRPDAEKPDQSSCKNVGFVFAAAARAVVLSHSGFWAWSPQGYESSVFTSIETANGECWHSKL